MSRAVRAGALLLVRVIGVHKVLEVIQFLVKILKVTPRLLPLRVLTVARKFFLNFNLDPLKNTKYYYD